MFLVLLSAVKKLRMVQTMKQNQNSGSLVQKFAVISFISNTPFFCSFSCRIVNLFLFYPNYGGKIESFAVYGSNLQGHYNAMRSSMMAFGMHITSISMESGASDYVDVYIEY